MIIYMWLLIRRIPDTPYVRISKICDNNDDYYYVDRKI